MATKRERRLWALELASVLLQSDMDTFGDLGEFSESEAAKLVEEVRAIADELKRRAKKMKSKQVRGWEATWPLTFAVYQPDGEFIGRYLVERESVPRFTPVEVREVNHNEQD